MAKRNGKGKGKGNLRPHNKPKTSRDIPLPKTLRSDLKPYDTNNDGVLSAEEKSAMKLAKLEERLEEQLESRRAEAKKGIIKPD